MRPFLVAGPRRLVRFAWALLVGWSLVLSGLQAARLPEPVVPAGVGVNIHFNRGHTRDLDLIAAAGFRWVRMDLGWAGIERQPGQYDWSAYDELTANLERRGLSAIYILDYSNPLYEETVASRNPITGGEQRDTASPQHPVSVAAFARWAAAAAVHFRGRPVIWEIWNEPNITFWKPKPDVAQYAELARATGAAIRAVEPKAIIIAPATSEVPVPFLEGFFRAGGLDSLDAVSIHPYRSSRLPPETALADYARVRGLIERHAPPPKRRLPIISGEWGYTSHTKGVSLDVQAAYLVRQQLVNLSAGVPISIWYDWKNDGPDPAEREHNFGTVTADLQPKPAYVALQTMTRALAGGRFLRRLETAHTNDYVLMFSGTGGTVRLAAWTVGEGHGVELPVKVARRSRIEAVTSPGVAFGLTRERHGAAGADTLTAAPATGEAEVRLGAERLGIKLGAAPVYLTLHGIKPR